MATNEIQGDLVGLYFSTNLVTPDWKEVVCAENTGLDGTRDVNSKRTKCGVIKGFGPSAYSITGSGAANTTPGTGKMSADDILDLFQNETDVLVKMEHATTAALYSRVGKGQVTRYSETANTGDVVSYDLTVDISGPLTLL
jgi:hypothetical protein